MELNEKKYKYLKWTARILALTLLIFVLPFYFGYGNPLPFIKSTYTLWDNTWLCVFPLMLFGLGYGWKNPKIGGILIVLPTTIGFIIGLIATGDLTPHIFVPYIIGILYLILGFSRIKISEDKS